MALLEKKLLGDIEMSNVVNEKSLTNQFRLKTYKQLELLNAQTKRRQEKERRECQEKGLCERMTSVVTFGYRGGRRKIKQTKKKHSRQKRARKRRTIRRR